MPRRRRRNRPKRLPNLPTEVWLYIFELLGKFDDDGYAVLSLASVNRFLRGIALPVLFRTICLWAPDWDFSISFRNRLHLEEVIRRIRYINTFPHVLNVVRRLTLTNWWICPCDDDSDMSDGSIESDEYLTDDSDFDPFEYREAFREFVELRDSACREIVTLVSSLPRLHHLQIHDCSFIPEFFSRTLCMPNLQSLHVNRCSLIPYTSKFQVTAPTPSLRIFQITLKHSCGPRGIDIVDLVISLIGQFAVFSFPFNVLYHLCVDKRLPTTLPRLQKLSIFNCFIETQDDHDDLDCIRSFLSLTPNLRELRIIGNIHSKTPLILSDTMVPNLEALMAPSYIANNIVLGRALEKIRIFTFRPRELRKDYTVVSQNIKHVTYNGALDDPEEELSHLASVFPNATTIVIIVTKLGYGNKLQEISKAVLSILPSFRHLRSCRVAAHDKNYEDFSHPTSYCPIGFAFEPEYRSHPTVEDIQILSFHRWFWRPKDGWHVVRSTDDTDEFDELRTQFFFKVRPLFLSL